MFSKIKYFLDQHIILSAAIATIVMMLIENLEGIVTRVMYKLESSHYDWWHFAIISNLFKIFLFTLIYTYLLTPNRVQKENTKDIVYLILKFILIYVYILYMMIAIFLLEPLSSENVCFSDISEVLNIDKNSFILLFFLFIFPIVFIRKKVIPTFLFVISLILPFVVLLFSKFYIQEYVSLYGGDGRSMIIIDTPNKIFTFSISPEGFTCSATLVLLLFVYHKIGRANNSNPITTTSNSQQDNELNEIQFDSKM